MKHCNSPLAGRPDCEGEQHRPQQRHPGGFQFSIIFQLYSIFGQFDVIVNRSPGRSCDGVKDCDRGSHVGGEEAEAAVGGEVGGQGGEKRGQGGEVGGQGGNGGGQGGEVGVQGGEEGEGGEVRGLEEMISSRLAE